MCVVSLFNVYDQAKRIQAVEEVGKRELDASWVPGPGDDEVEVEEEWEEEEDEEADELDVMKARQFGTRKSNRKRSQPAAGGAYMLDSSAIAMSEDSE